MFIAGLTHSGSTLLDLMLGSTGRFIGLGEVVALLRPESARKLNDPDRRCSCGSLLSYCPFWSRVIEALRRTPNATTQERYLLLLDLFHEVFGSDKVPVDSSKSFRALQVVAGLPHVEPKVIHLLRDVRGWAVSRRDIEERAGPRIYEDLRQRVGRRAWLHYYPRRNAFARFLVWYRGNRKFQKFLSRQESPPFVVSYEELALDTVNVIEKLCPFLGIDPTERMYEISESDSHIALGNPMRLDDSKLERISYDCRWFQRKDWMIPALLLPHVMRFNSDWVYTNSDYSPSLPMHHYASSQPRGKFSRNVEGRQS